MINNSSRAEGSGNETSSPDGMSLLKKTVLLVDVNPQSRESRAKVMRTLGVMVDCASSVRSARSKMDAGAYNLILVDLGSDSTGAEALVGEIRLRHPRQPVAFLVGSPLFVAKSLRKEAGRARAAQTIVPPPIAPVETTGKPFDFSQKIKDAEAEEVA